MDWLRRKRIKQIISYGWKDAAIIAKEQGISRIKVFFNIFCCFRKYNVFSYQYKQNRLWKLSPSEFETKATELGKGNLAHDRWVIENYKNHKFLGKWTQKKWENTPKGSLARKKAYTKFFNTGKDLHVQYNVEIRREHFLWGTISIGNNVLLAKNVFIDYSGFLEIHDNVSLADGVIIETHSHVSGAFALKGKGQLEQTHLVIEESVSVGSRAMILETCTRIGRHARIGAGAVVRKNIPPYAVAIGNPAKIVGFVMTPEDVATVEENYPEEKRISIEQYKKEYDKYFKSRIKDIRKYVNN